MKAVMISIQPKWCELIASGKKTVEVRKTKPKIETPFKCYIYMTAGCAYYPAGNNMFCYNNGGRVVIGEFVCDKITSTVMWRLKGNTGMCAKRTEWETELPQKSCLTLEEIELYAGSENRIVYGWNISDLVIYSTPKSLREFARYSEDDIRPCAKEYGFCQHEYFDYQENCNACDIDFDGENCPYIKMSRPPQSWCYVEDLR